jgi:hypothetical protein
MQRRHHARHLLSCLLLAFAWSAAALARDSGGTAFDPKTGARFPAQLGVFARNGGVRYDEGGYPMVSYFAGSLIVLDLYYYPDALSFAQEFNTCRDYVKIATPNARLISDRSSTLKGSGRRATFSMQSKFLGAPNVKLFSELLLFRHRDRFLKFRVTYRADHADRARQEIDSFIGSFKLP